MKCYIKSQIILRITKSVSLFKIVTRHTYILLSSRARLTLPREVFQVMEEHDREPA
uniref:Uncharacterized protein n=1 Tax=Arundo donax TaxID=35708 RepID=A0A0A9HNQ9_ARUDO